MSASGDGTRGSPKSKGKTLRSFFGSLPGFSSAWNPVSHTKCSTKDVQTAVDPSGTPVPPSPVATNPQMARDASGLLQLSEQTAGDKNMGSIGATSSQDAFYSGVAGIMDAAKGKVQGSLSATQLALVGTKETVSGGVMGAVDMAKGLVKGGLDTSKSVLMGTKDTVTTGLTGAVNMAKGTVQTGLDTSKSVLMGTKDTVTTGLTGTMNLAKGTVQTGLDTSKSVLMGTKDTVTTGLTGTMNLAKGSVQTGLDTSKSVLMGTKDMVTTGLTGAVNLAKGSVQTGLDTSKSVLMGTKDTVTTGLTGTMNMAKGTVQMGLDTSKSVLMGTKDTVATGLTGAVNMAKGTVQTGLDTSKSVLMGTKDTVTTGLTGTMNLAKGTVQTGLDTSKSVLMGTKDTVTTGLTGAVNVVKGVAQGGLDTSKSVLMGPKNTVCAGAPGAINVVKGAAQGGLDTSNSAFPGTKSAMLAGFAGAMDMARGTAQTGLHPSKHILTGTEDMVCAGVTSIMDTAKDSQKNMDTTRDRLSTMLAHSAIRSMEECGHPAATHFATLPDELKGLGDFFQPMTAEEQAQLAASESGSRVLSANRGSYYICLGDLAPSFRQRAFEHALSHIQHNQFQARAALAQLQEAFQMIPTEFGKDRDIVGCKVADSWGKSMMRASVAQDRLCALVHQLHAAYSSLATSLQGLPEVQQQAGQARHSLCKLYGLVTSEAGSELQTEQLAQSSAGVVQAWQGLEVLLDKLQQNPPLDWLVGPFTLMPCGQLQAPEGWVGGVPRDHAMTTDDCTSPKLWIEQDQRVLRK